MFPYYHEVLVRAVLVVFFVFNGYRKFILHTLLFLYVWEQNRANALLVKFSAFALVRSFVVIRSLMHEKGDGAVLSIPEHAAPTREQEPSPLRAE